jgi:hypothetical protein
MKEKKVGDVNLDNSRQEIEEAIDVGDLADSWPVTAYQ